MKIIKRIFFILVGVIALLWTAGLLIGINEKGSWDAYWNDVNARLEQERTLSAIQDSIIKNLKDDDVCYCRFEEMSGGHIGNGLKNYSKPTGTGVMKVVRTTAGECKRCDGDIISKAEFDNASSEEKNNDNEVGAWQSFSNRRSQVDLK